MGSDIHVMLALCCRSRQVVMANEELHGPDMVGELLGKRQRCADQTRHALSQCVVEALDVIRFPRKLGARVVLRRRNHLLIHAIWIGLKCGVVTVRLGDLGPQVLSTRVAASAHVKGHDLAGRGIHGDPHPLLGRFLLHKAGEFIGFHLQPLDQHIAGTGDGWDMEMIRQGREALDQKPPEPLEGDAHRTTGAAQRETFQQQTFDERPLILREEILCKTVDKLPFAVVAVMILFAVVNMPVFLKLGGLTPWTDVSDDHGVQWTSTDG